MLDYQFTKQIDRVFSRLLSNFYVGNFLLFLLNNFVKTEVDRPIVLIGAMQGKFYGDNSKHLFEYLLTEQNDLDVYWVTRNYKLYKTIRADAKPVLYIYSYAYLKKFLSAGKGVYTDSLRDLFLGPFIVHDKFRLVNLRHGRSVKRVRFARRNHKISVKEFRERQFETDKTFSAISTSPFISDIQELCLKIGHDKHVVTGYPRNDSLIRLSQKTDGNLHTKASGINVLYAPSWRHGRSTTNFFPFDDFDLKEMDELLGYIGLHIYIRPHVGELFASEMKDFLSSIQLCSNLSVISHFQCSDINSVLHEFDVLISDYSAIYHDFLLLDRPIILIPYDFDRFNHENGFLYDYFEMIPGPSVLSFSVLKCELEKISKGVDSHSLKRRTLKGIVHQYSDALSCQRVQRVLEKM